MRPSHAELTVRTYRPEDRDRVALALAGTLRTLYPTGDRQLVRVADFLRDPARPRPGGRRRQPRPCVRAVLLRDRRRPPARAHRAPRAEIHAPAGGSGVGALPRPRDRPAARGQVHRLGLARDRRRCRPPFRGFLDLRALPSFPLGTLVQVTAVALLALALAGVLDLTPLRAAWSFAAARALQPWASPAPVPCSPGSSATAAPSEPPSTAPPACSSGSRTPSSACAPASDAATRRAGRPPTRARVRGRGGRGGAGGCAAVPRRRLAPGGTRCAGRARRA